MGKPSKARGGGSFAAALLPCIERYATSHDVTDIDALVEHLRRGHDKYARQKLVPFRNAVARAVAELQATDRVQRRPCAEYQLQALEARHLASRRASAKSQASGGSGSGSASVGSGSGAASVSGESVDELDDAFDAAGISDALTGRTLKPGTGANASLLSLYSTVAAAAAVPQSDAATPTSAPAPAQQQSTAAKAAAAAVRAGVGSKGRHISKAVEAPPSPPPMQSAAAAAAPAASAPPDLSAARAAAGAPAAAAPVSEAAPGKSLLKTRRSEEAALDKGRSEPSKRARVGGRSARASSNVTAPRPVRYADLGGIEAVLGQIQEVIEYPLRHPEVYAWLGVEPPRGVLLHGPPGCGKTALANAIAYECGVPFLKISGPEIVSGMSGESEAKLRQLFTEAQAIAPCIVFIDEIDAIMPKRETAQREMERRIVAQMLTCLDDLTGGGSQGSQGGDEGGAEAAGEANTPREHRHVVIIGATNRPDALDAALRRAGRFDREIAMGIPSEQARAQILAVLAKRLRLSGDFDFRAVAKRTPGFVGADLAALAKEAAAIAVKRIFRSLEERAVLAGVTAGAAVAAEAAARDAVADVCMELGDGPELSETAVAPRFGAGRLAAHELADCAISQADFDAAVGMVQPSVRREGFSTTPDVTWDDVGALEEVREELCYAITHPIRFPERFEALGLAAGAGVLLYGPPGCGKTLVAKAVANESGANFISIKGPELLNKYVGESERAVRQLFSRARAAAPCVLFFDEMDALAPRRGSDVNHSTERVVNQLLTEMDGTEARGGVYLVAATNRPDMLDPALLRPGRLDKVLYIPLPPAAGRPAILSAAARRMPLAPDVDLDAVGRAASCDGFSGADLAALVREAAVMALKESMQGGGGGAITVSQRHFERAVRGMAPSVSRADQRRYDALRNRLRASRAHIEPQAAASEGGPDAGATPDDELNSASKPMEEAA